MHVIVCLDDNQGMLFHKRRQSRDSKVYEDIAGLTTKLWVATFSEGLFREISFETPIETLVDEEFLKNAGGGEYCFVENRKVQPYIDSVENMIIYRWNRKYPSDFHFDVSLQDWMLVEQKDFAGTSHDKITREIYARRMLK